MCFMKVFELNKIGKLYFTKKRDALQFSSFIYY
jgi:hypothetical protein